MGYDRWYLHVDADERLVFDGARVDGRPGRGLADLVAFAEARGFAGCAACSSTSTRRGRCVAAPSARRPAVRRRRLPRGALPRAGLAQGRAAAARLRRRPRAHQVPAVPHPRRRAGVEPAPPAPLPRELPLGLLPRAPARQVRPGLPRPGRARRRRGQLLAGQPRVPPDARRARPRPRARARLSRQPALPRARRPRRRRADRADPLGRPAAGCSAASPAGAAAGAGERCA